jgi:hypothetical protein
MLFELAPNLGYSVERFEVPHPAALAMPDDAFVAKQWEAFDFVRTRIDQGLPCYAWELTHIPAYYVITGYDDSGYTYSGWDSDKQGVCPWDKLGTYDVKQLSVNCVRPTEAASETKVVKDALSYVLARIERPDGWAISDHYQTGLPAYEMWAEALETGRAIRDGEAYVSIVWRECREMAVAFLEEAKARLPGICNGVFDGAIAHYTDARDRLVALSELHPERPDGWDWTSTLASAEGASLVRGAGGAETAAVPYLQGIVDALSRVERDADWHEEGG